MLIYSVAGFVLLQPVRPQLRESRLNVAHFKEGAILCRIASIFSEADLNTIPT